MSFWTSKIRVGSKRELLRIFRMKLLDQHLMGNTWGGYLGQFLLGTMYLKKLNTERLTVRLGLTVI